MSRDEIAHALKRGARVRGILCSYVTLPHTTPRSAVVVSKKVGRTAVQRNRIKRRVRAALRTARTTLGNRSLVVLAQPAASQATVGEFVHEITTRLNRAV